MFKYIPQIKKHYERITPYIMEANGTSWVSPYTNSLDWLSIFSPIEEATWMDLRSFGNTPLYPQYPTGKYFLDFGNPKFKVALECDGKEWHIDKEKDAKRDLELLADGWHIFRIGGKECFKVTDKLENRYYFDIEERADIYEEFYLGVEGLIKALGIFYFGFKGYSFEEEFDLAFRCIMRFTSPIQYKYLMEDRGQKYFKLITEYNDYTQQATSTE